MLFNILSLISRLAETANAMVTLIGMTHFYYSLLVRLLENKLKHFSVVRYEMENQYAIASTAQKEKHAINACHFSMTGLGNEEPKKIPTNVSVSTGYYPKFNRKSSGSKPEFNRKWIELILFSGCNCNLHARKCKFDPKTFNANKKS